MLSRINRTSLQPIFPVIEVMAIYTMFLWGVWYTHLNSAFTWFPISTLLLLGYLIIVSPALTIYVLGRTGKLSSPSNLTEYYFLSRGIGAPIQYFSGGKKSLLYKNRLTVMLILVLMSTLMLFFVREHQVELVEFFQVDVGSWWKVFIICELLLVGLGIVSFSVLVRWDTLYASFWPVTIIAIGGAAVVLALHVFFRFFDDFPFVTGQSAADKWQLFSMQSFFAQWFGYFFWAWVQQFIFLALFVTGMTRCVDLASQRNRVAVIVVGALFFGMVHLPNIWLFMITTALGVVFTHVYLKHRNIFLIAMAHAFLAALYYHLLPIAMAPEIKNYFGPESFYFGARQFIFAVLPLCFFLLLYAVNRQRLVANTLVAISLGLLLYGVYPASIQGPEFYWGGNSNGLSWRLHDLKITENTKDNTTFISKGNDPYLISHPIGMSKDEIKFIEVDMLVSPYAADDIAAVFFDEGNDFNVSAMQNFKLKEGRAKYRIPVQLESRLFRLRLDPSVKTGSKIKLFSLKLFAENNK